MHFWTEEALPRPPLRATLSWGEQTETRLTNRMQGSLEPSLQSRRDLPEHDLGAGCRDPTKGFPGVWALSTAPVGVGWGGMKGGGDSYHLADVLPLVGNFTTVATFHLGEKERISQNSWLRCPQREGAGSHPTLLNHSLHPHKWSQ